MTNDTADARFQYLVGLTPGWLDGDGETIRVTAIDQAHEVLGAVAQRVPSRNRPGIFPTEEGGVSLEWTEPGTACHSVEVQPDGSLYVHLFWIGQPSQHLETNDLQAAISMVVEALTGRSE